MAIASAKPAPLPLGVTERRDGTNRVELLPKPVAKTNPLVDQLLEDFARSAAKPAAGRTNAAPPAPAPAPMAKAVAPEAEALRLHVQALERRLQSLEARQNAQQAERQEDAMTRRVLAVLEQLSAELREHLSPEA